ncbi:hypothetical protein CBR_g46213 [Chara braunii]|uniref:Peptidase A1 domain-containing protein n=1 Tax=Chara braunii TaxID=69332 RepID=A0A388K3Q2_CHABU|nr:hypothetical protein CBR_g46213 [Chara braunii]|eukprot:GBG64671.1 hypothetical protein CBR_g46213 [Chara braunii]
MAGRVLLSPLPLIAVLLLHIGLARAATTNPGVESLTRITLPLTEIRTPPINYPRVYAVNVTLGTPGQPRTLVVDVNSQMTWTHSYKTPAFPAVKNKINPPFYTANSSSVKFTGCKTDECSAAHYISTSLAPEEFCLADDCGYNVTLQIDDNDVMQYTAGVLGSDVLGIGGNKMVSSGPLGFSFVTEGRFANLTTDGVLGLAMVNTSTLSSLVKLYNIPKTISICIDGAAGGVLSLGQLPVALEGETLKYMALVDTTDVLVGFDMYAVNVSGAAVTGFAKTKPLNYVGVLNTAVDMTFVPLEMYSGLLTLLKESASVPTFDVQVPGMNITCYNAPSCDVTYLPTATIDLANVTLTATPQDYTFSIPTENGQCVVCFNILPWGFDNAMMIGANFLKKTWMIIDAEKKRVAFTNSKPCK